MTIQPISQEQKNILIHSFTVEERGTVIFAEKKEDYFVLTKQTFNTCEGDVYGTATAKSNLCTWLNTKNVTFVDVAGRNIITNSEKARELKFKDDLKVSFITAEMPWVHYIESVIGSEKINEPQRCVIL